MLKILFLTMFLSNFIGSLAAQGPSNSHKYQICTDMAFSHMIRIRITSPIPLPQNLAFALNGKTINLDECNPYDLGSIEVPPGREIINLAIAVSGENFDKYFPRGFKKPASNIMNLIIYDREKCTDPHSQFQEAPDIRISWEPVYMNGEHCGTTTFMGESRIDL